MTSKNNEREAETLSPDDAFAVLGNETRMEILHALAEADSSLSFSELRDRVGVRDSGQFNYHLDKAEGHFVRKTDDRYELRQAGRRVIGAILSGAITDEPVLEPTRIDDTCPACDAPALVAFAEGRVEHYCSECTGYYGRRVPTSVEPPDGATEYGYLGSFQLPPAGVQGRTPSELFWAASTWGLLRFTAVASRVCPHCSAPLAHTIRVCDDHDSAREHCDDCDNRHGIQFDFDCTNCLYGGEAAFAVALMTDSHLLEFLVEHGINPMSPSDPAGYIAALMDYEEEILSVDPFEARFEFTLDGDALTLTVDADLNVVDVRQR